MNGIQLDLFTFATMQIQEKSTEVKPAVMLKNFINDGKYPLPTAKSERISINSKLGNGQYTRWADYFVKIYQLKSPERMFSPKTESHQ